MLLGDTHFFKYTPENICIYDKFAVVGMSKQI